MSASAEVVIGGTHSRATGSGTDLSHKTETAIGCTLKSVTVSEGSEGDRSK
jgi:hypothetical protein